MSRVHVAKNLVLTLPRLSKMSYCDDDDDEALMAFDIDAAVASAADAKPAAGPGATNATAEAAYAEVTTRFPSTIGMFAQPVFFV